MTAARTADPETRRRVVVVILSTALLTVALLAKDALGVWAATSMAGFVGLGAAAMVDGERLRALLRPHRFAVAVGLAVGLAMSVATWTLYPVSAELLPAVSTQVEQLYGLLRQRPGPVVSLPLLVVVVLFEELVFRGVLIDALRARWRALPSVVVSAVVYTIPQLGMQSTLLAAVALGCGIVWGTLRIATGGLVAPIVAHLTWNLLVFVAFPVA